MAETVGSHSVEFFGFVNIHVHKYLQIIPIL